MGSFAAQVACAVSGDYTRLSEYRQLLAPTRQENSNAAFIDLVCRSLATGFAEKWQVMAGIWTKGDQCCTRTEAKEEAAM